MIENFINSIDVVDIYGEPLYYYKGDGSGDFEKIHPRIKSVKLLDDYEEWLETQIEYVRILREKETQI